MNDDFLVSVIIPVYNAENFLENAVNSAIVLPEVGEVVLIEDGSTDGSLTLSRELSDKYNKIKLLQHPGGVNKGAGASRNLGIIGARFPYIGFLDADDYFLPNRYAMTKKKFLENKNVDAVYEPVGTIFLDQEGKLPYSRFKSIPLDQVEGDISYPKIPYSGFRFFQSLVRGDNGFPCTDGITIRKNVFEKVGFFNEKLKLHQDTEFWIRASYSSFFSPADHLDLIAMRGVHKSNRITQRNYDSLYKYISSLHEWSGFHIQGTVEHEIIKKKYYDLKAKSLLGVDSFIAKILWRIMYWINS